MGDASKVLNKGLMRMNDEIIFNYKLQNENDVNHSERNPSRIQNPTFHVEVHRFFHNAGHWYNDMQNCMTP